MKTIGEGTFGKVKLGTHILTGERVAVKVLEKERIVDAADVGRVAREIHILKLIRHAHIIQLYEIIETPRQLYLIMEYAPGGELFDYIVHHGRAQEPEACRFLHQILAGIEKVHAMRVVHRDLKPENLLLDDRKDIKIVDFGLSNTYQEGQLLSTACGSPCYAAPEMIAGKAYVPSMVDIWSCGVILFALVCGYLPFEDQNHAELYQKILNADYEVPDFISKDVTDLIAAMLTTDPEKRITLDGIRQHKWYRQMPEASLPDIDGFASLDRPLAKKMNGKASKPAVILDEEILDQLESYGFSRDYAVKCLQTNKHNHLTTTYHLLKAKKQRSQTEVGSKTGISTALADLEARCFQAFDSEPVAPIHAALEDFVMEPLQCVASVATPSRAVRQEAGVPRLDLNGLAKNGASAVGGGAPRISSRSPAPVPCHPEVVEAYKPATARQARPQSARDYGSKDNNAQAAPATARTSRRAGSPWNVGVSGYVPQRAYRDRPVYGNQSPREVTEVPMTARPRLQGDAPTASRENAYSVRSGVPPGSARSQPRATSCGVVAQMSARARQSNPSVEGRRNSRPGVMHVSCSSSLPPNMVMSEVVRALALQQIPYRQMSSRVLRCQTAGVRIEACVSSSTGGSTTLQLVRAAGDAWHYRDLCAQLLSEMQL